MSRMKQSYVGQQFSDDSDAGLKRLLVNYLRANGFISPSINVSLGSRIVDVLAFRQGFRYGFEAKSSADNLIRGIEQCRDYAKHLNYVILATTKRPSIQFVKTAKDEGVGVWRIYLPKYIKELVQPKFRGQISLVLT